MAWLLRGADRGLPLSPVDKLTHREREIIRALGRGLTDKEIAEKFDITLQTVRIHVYNARRALGANSRAHAVALLLTRTRV